MRYAGFWLRLASMLIDVVVVLPLVAILLLLGESRLFQVYWFIPGILFELWYNVILVARYGGTPGKLLVGIRIALVDGRPVTRKAAARRFAVQFTLNTLTSLGLILAALGMTQQHYASLGFLARGKELSRLAPPWYHVLQPLATIWFWGELITMLTNRRRRAVHDYIGGTVVLRVDRATVAEGAADAIAAGVQTDSAAV